MDTAPIIVAVTSLLIFSNGFYIVAEFSLVHARHSRIAQQATAGNQFARLLEPMISDARRLDTSIAACHIGIALSSIVLGFYGQWSLSPHLARLLDQISLVASIPSSGTSFVAALLILLLLTVLQIIFGNIIPRSIAILYPEEMALFIVFPLRWSIAFFRPAIELFHRIAALILRVFQVPTVAYRGHTLSPEEIELLAKESFKSGLIAANEQQLLHNVFRAGELTAAEVMVPRTRLVSASIDTPLNELLELTTTSAHTRIPVYRDSIDNVVGSIHVRDLFRLHTEDNENVQRVLRKVSYVAESKPALAVWHQLRQENSYIAIVLDEFGGTAGMITVADLLEEIFGELQDEFDNQPALITRGPDGGARLHGKVLIADVNEWFGLNLPDEEVNTIGGLIMATLGRLPDQGDEVTFDQVRLQVQDINGPAILEVNLYTPPRADLHEHDESGKEP